MKSTLKKLRVISDRLLGQHPEICDDLDAWLGSNGSGRKLGTIGESGVVERSLPEGAEQHARFAEEASYRIHPRVIGRVSGATIFGAEGMIQLPDQRYLMQTVWYPEQLVHHPQYYRRPAGSQRVTGIYHALIQYWSRNYYHWMTETLPILHGLDALLPTGTRHIVPGPVTRFQKESLALLGIHAERRVEIGMDESWKIDELIISPPATTCFTGTGPVVAAASPFSLQDPPPFMGPFNHSPEGLRWLADRMITAARKEWNPQAPASRKIYITRRAAACRRLNDKDLAPLFAQHGIEVCELEGMPLAEQIRLFHQADLIIAPHGAGLSNLMFCRPDTHVIEIFEPSVIRLCYWAISNIAGLGYNFIVGEALGTGHPDPDIRMDPARLAAILARE